MTGEAGTGGQLWLHQAESLGALDRGENVVVATATASGKSMVFQAWTLHGIKASSEPTSEPTTLVFYPTKALANDQETTLAGGLRAGRAAAGDRREDQRRCGG